MVIHKRHPAHLKYPNANKRPSLIKNFLDVQIIKMHVSGSSENFKYFFALVLKLLMKNISNLLVRLFVISLLTFRYFSVIVSLFGAGAATIFTAPAPAPATSKPFRRLQLRLRLRPKCVGSGGSGSGSGSGSASLAKTKCLFCPVAHYFILSNRTMCTKLARKLYLMFWVLVWRQGTLLVFIN